MTLRRVVAAGAVVAVAVVAAQVQAASDNLKKLQDFKTSGTPLTLETVDQGGAKAAAIGAIADRVKLPPGFKIELYAIVPDARHMAVGNNVGTVFVGTRKTAVWAVTDRDKDRVGDEVKRFAPSIEFSVPNGVCFSDDGFLYIAEHNRLMVFPAAEFFYEGPDVAVGIVKQPLIPVSEESFNHGARTCEIGPDNKLYVTQGQPYNVPAPEKLELYNEKGIGAIVRMDRDGSNWEVYARGIRNSVGQGFNPANGELWFTDNQVDGMGDLIPPGELNRTTGAGQHFGFPWFGGGKVRTNEYANSEPPADAIFPAVEMDAHAADLGMTFYTGKMFPPKYRGGIFIAQHGSWNRTDPVGARIMFTSLDEDGAAAGTEVFAYGWLDEETGEYHGRPVDVVQYLDGSLLVSDDQAGAIYRISYGE
ncbi:MAG: PQQ-dependent sugar dehydrogenase [Rhodospirillales bacterium]|nr:PQQ-dependent sugar dehydrogenase [Rhodospirillales bacterium]